MFITIVLLLKHVTGYMKGILRVQFSDRDSPFRQDEEAAYMHFVDFLDEAEGY